MRRAFASARRRRRSSLPIGGADLVLDLAVESLRYSLADGASMSAWPDASGKGATVLQSNGSFRPTYRIVGGVPYVTFTTVGSCLNVTWPSAIKTDEATTIIVGRNAGGTATDQIFFHLAADQTTYSLHMGGGQVFGQQNSPRLSGLASPVAWSSFALAGSLSGAQRPEGPGATLWLNGQRGYRTQDANALGWTSLTGITAGVVGGLSTGTGALWCQGDIRRVLHYTRRLSDAELAIVFAYLAQQYGLPTPLSTPTRNLVFEGDSLTVGFQGTTLASGYADQVIAALPASLRTYNLGITGQTLTQIAADASTQVDPLYDAAVAKNTLVVWGGTNDMAATPSNPTAAYNSLVSYCSARKAAHPWKIVVLTCLPRGATAQFETDRQAFNTNVRTNFATFADALADIGNDATIGAAGAQNNATNYQGDKIHLTSAGYAIAAGLVTTAVNSV